MTDETNMPGNVPENNTPPAAPTPPPDDPVSEIDDRINRLSGEPAPDISPEDFARLQRLGSLHIDSHGRVRVNRREETDAGVSLKKRRAWYSNFAS